MGTPSKKTALGIEVLVKKAAVDPHFKDLLLKQGADAAAEIGLELGAAERTMIDSVPRPQLEGMIAQTNVEPRLRQVLLGSAAAAMLLALGASATTGCKRRSATLGITPDRVKSSDGEKPADGSAAKEEEPRDSAKPPQGEEDRP